MSTHDRFIEQAIALARASRAQGNHPFGALLVVDGKVALAALNSVVTDRNPTAHAETNLVQLALRRIAPADLRRAVLYTSCEPCAMCVGTIYWAGIRAVVYALSTEELAAMAGGEFVVPCRDLFARARQPVSVVGPLASAAARDVHAGYWTNTPAIDDGRASGLGSRRTPERVERT